MIDGRSEHTTVQHDAKSSTQELYKFHPSKLTEHFMQILGLHEINAVAIIFHSGGIKPLQKNRARCKVCKRASDGYRTIKETPKKMTNVNNMLVSCIN